MTPPIIKKRHFNFEEGEIVLLDKPLDWTSFDVVKKLRQACKIKKIGHAGTLDPKATGLLIICIGRKATRQIEELQGMDKEYTGAFFIGATRPSCDLETDIDQTYSIDSINPEQIHAAAKHFTGAIEQIPPVFSAIKVDGKRAYKKARKGEKVKLKARTVFIHEFEITKIELPLVYFKIVCSKGTYIRSVARDFGKYLNSGAYLSSLRRTKIGEYQVADAWDIQELADVFYENRKEN